MRLRGLPQADKRRRTEEDAASITGIFREL